MINLFGTDGVRGTANQYPITAGMALKLGKAAAIVLRKNADRPTFLIGKDTRLSGYMLEYGLTAGITSIGADVLLVGPMPTPAIAQLTKSFAADAGIMISASHNPAEDNGIKFFDHAGFKLPDKVEARIAKLALERDLSTYNAPADRIGRAVRIDDARGRYIEFAKASVANQSLKGLKVVLDCAHGAGYKVSPLICRELGADVITINNKPDGMNINKDAGATHPEIIRSAVLSHQADIGITLDGDGDRVIIVDEKGKILDGDHILAMCAIDLHKRSLLAKDTVVVTVYTNLAFDKLMEKHGINVVRVGNGDRYVIEKMKQEGYNLGGEQSGHIIFSDFNTTGDGTIAALQVLALMKRNNKKLSVLAGVLAAYPQIIKNVHVLEKKPIGDMKSVQEAIHHAEQSLQDKGRVFVRYSGTQMLCRVMIEGEDEQLIKKLANRIALALHKEVEA